MVDPFTVVGSIASIFQIVGSLTIGLRSLRDTVKAVKGATTVVKHVEDKVQRTEYYFRLVDDIMKQRPSGIPDEVELQRVVQDLTANCLVSLNVLQERLPKRNAQNIVQAFRLWVDDGDIKQALKHIDEYTNYSSLLLQALNL